MTVAVELLKSPLCVEKWRSMKLGLAARGGGRIRVANGLARRAQITTKSRLSGASPVASVANWMAALARLNCL